MFGGGGGIEAGCCMCVGGGVGIRLGAVFVGRGGGRGWLGLG